MARDFRPKDKKKAPRPSADAAAAGSSAPPARPAMARPVKAAPRPAAAAAAPTDSGNSSDVDDDTLMREIAALGGSKEDLELVGRGKTKGKGKGKAEEEADDVSGLPAPKKERVAETCGLAATPRRRRHVVHEAAQLQRRGAQGGAA
jgi:hypothetical protein